MPEELGAGVTHRAPGLELSARGGVAELGEEYGQGDGARGGQSPRPRTSATLEALGMWFAGEEGDSVSEEGK